MRCGEYLLQLFTIVYVRRTLCAQEGGAVPGITTTRLHHAVKSDLFGCVKAVFQGIGNSRGRDADTGGLRKLQSPSLVEGLLKHFIGPTTDDDSHGFPLW